MEHAYDISQLALVLAMAFAGEVLLQRLRQPALIAYILVGVILGPSVLAVVKGQAQIDFLAELGILLLLFIVGLELDLKKFAASYKLAIGTTLIQIGASLFVTAIIAWLFDWPVARAIILGFAISLSSTAVAIKLLEDIGEQNTAAGRTALGILVAQDLAVIPMMLVTDSFAAGRFEPWGLLKIGAALGLMGWVMWSLSRRNFIVPLPEWLRNKTPLITDSSQTVIKALAYCFSGAALSGALGLSASYGAFLAGLIIGSTQDKEKLEHHARPIFDVLMMVFFLSVGLLLDMHFIVKHFWALAAMLLLIMTLKTVVNIAILRRAGLSRHDALTIGTALGQIGEFSFVLAALGLSINALQPDAYKYMVTLIALSLTLTPLWLYTMRRIPLAHRRLRRLLPVAADGDGGQKS